MEHVKYFCKNIFMYYFEYKIRALQIIESNVYYEPVDNFNLCKNGLFIFKTRQF